MKCNHCFHLLPDDSEYCQYCGRKIDISMPEPSLESTKKGSEPDENTNIQHDQNFVDSVVSTFEKILADNAKNQPNFENDLEFGLVPEKPIYTPALKLVEGETSYLKKLRTANGEKLIWSRRGSTQAEGVSGMVDIYDTSLVSGTPYKTIYINMYGAKESQKAPAGFIFEKSGQKQKKEKKKYCKYCGADITGQKKCENCRANRISVRSQQTKKWRTITALIIGLLLIGNITLGILLFENHKNTNALTQELSSKDVRIEELESSLKESKQSMQESIDTYRLGYDRYNSVLDACKDGNIGYASSKFLTNESIVAINRLTLSSKITLTANYNTNVSISLNTEGNAADVNFDEDSWYGSTTTLTIKPKYRGVTIATFSNSIDSDTFSVIIIVY